MQGLSLNFPYLPEDRSSKRNSIVMNTLCRNFITGNAGGQYHVQINFTTAYPLFLRGPIHLSPKSVTFLYVAYIVFLLAL
jgi:hypothetical protein